MSTENTYALLFPSSYFDQRKVDEDLLYEYDAASDTNAFDIILFSYEKWFLEGKLLLDKPPKRNIKAVYRGWMMKPDIYSLFYRQLAEKGIELITTPEQYERFHIFPNIYHVLSEDTAEMIVFPDGKVNLDKVRQRFDRFMVKDYVKSVKGTAFPRYFEKSVTEMEFAEAMELFKKYRGNLLTGGICIKEYLDLKRYGDYTNEFRVYYIRGNIATISLNSNQQSFVSKPPDKLLKKYEGLDSPFYTLDYAELEDGRWKILEAGDGQVSGLSPGQDGKAFFRFLSVML